MQNKTNKIFTNISEKYCNKMVCFLQTVQLQKLSTKIDRLTSSTKKEKQSATVDCRTRQQSYKTDQEIDQVLAEINRKSERTLGGLKKFNAKVRHSKKEENITKIRKVIVLVLGQSFSLMRVRVFLILRCKLVTCRTSFFPPSAIAPIFYVYLA